MIDSIIKKHSARGIALYSLLLSIAMLSGVIRFSGISLTDEIAFLLLFLLIISHKKKIERGNSKNISKYYSRTVFSFKILFIYLIFSLLHGLFYDLYFGKIRWVIVFTALLLSDSTFFLYLSRRFKEVNRYHYASKAYKYVLSFCFVYVIYGLVAKYLGNIPVGLIQDVQTDAWYAIWGTSAYTAIIFIPLLLFSKALRSDGNLSRGMFLFVYAIVVAAAILYDSRVMMVILLLFFTAEIYQFRTIYKLIICSSVAVVVAVFGSHVANTTLASSGGFLISLIMDDGVIVRGDFDRIAHYIAAYNTLSNSFLDALIGKGFLNAGKAIIPEYHNVYNTFGFATGSITINLSGESISTFGLSAFFIENGLIGMSLLMLHLYNLCMVAIKTRLLVPSIYMIMAYASLLLIFYSIYINDNMMFYLMLSPSIFLYPLMKSDS